MLVKHKEDIVINSKIGKLLISIEQSKYNIKDIFFMSNVDLNYSLVNCISGDKFAVYKQF